MSMLFSAPEPPPAPPPIAPAAPRIINPYEPITETRPGEVIQPEEPISAPTMAEEERRRRSLRRSRQQGTMLTAGSGLTSKAPTYKPGMSLLASD